ncbi:MAG TPA: LAGLIDADG family homing endonuclease [Patescibacteria group bacterium]|nr:LAGLIDADG family homing endonuclease [Patescibacteria group bacterium]
MHALSKIKIEWSSDFAYVIGLLVTDGNLSKDGRHIIFTSKDKEMIDNVRKALSTSVKIALKSNGSNKEKKVK